MSIQGRECCVDRSILCKIDRLVGQVVKVSALRAEDPIVKVHLRQDFSEVESYQ